MKTRQLLAIALASVCCTSHGYEPSDSSFPQQWQLRNTGNDIDIDTTEAWDHTKGTSSVIVAVIDTGVDWTHEDLSHCVWSNPAEISGIPFWDDDLNGVVDDVHGAWILPTLNMLAVSPLDEVGHGTHVAGTIAAAIDNATSTGTNVVGVAPHVTIMPIKVNIFESAPFHMVAQGIYYAVNNGADVINISSGLGGWAGDLEQGILAPAISYAELLGVVVVASSGNIEGDPVNYPARFTSVIGVGAYNPSMERCDIGDWGTLSLFGWPLADAGSSYGEGLDIVAPGYQILSTLPGNAYGESSGTSMAAPHVAGVCALVKSVSPEMTPAQVRETICRTSDYIDDPNGDGTISPDEFATTTNPYGIPWNKYTGYGRVNAFSAVCRAKFPSRPTVQSVAFPGGVNDDIAVSFSEPMWSDSLSSGNVTLTGSTSGGHACTFSLNSAATTLTISSTSAFSPGETLTLVLSTGVIDAGKQSLLTSFSDVLQVGSTPPAAGIQSITPSSITQGDGDVTFDGSASSAITPGATLTTYKWTSSLDSQLYIGGNSSFTRDSSLLSAGQHTISLQVRDSNGLWSQTSAQGTLNVYEPGPDEGHDLRIDSITLDENVVSVNHDFAVDVMISNDGDYTEDSFTILYTLRNESGGIMDQETESAWSLAAGRTQGPGWVYLDPSSGYQGPVRIEVTINTPLDEDRSNNDGTASGYVGTLPAYDGYYGASWNYAPGGNDIVEGSYRIRPLY